MTQELEITTALKKILRDQCLWDLCGGLRGPDRGGCENTKWTFTARLRYLLCKLVGEDVEALSWFAVARAGTANEATLRRCVLELEAWHGADPEGFGHYIRRLLNCASALFLFARSLGNHEVADEAKFLSNTLEPLLACDSPDVFTTLLLNLLRGKEGEVQQQ